MKLSSVSIAAVVASVLALPVRADPTFGNLPYGWNLGSQDPGSFAYLESSSPEILLGLRTSDANGTPSGNDGSVSPSLVTYTVHRGTAWTLDMSVTGGEAVFLDGAGNRAFDILLDVDWGTGSRQFNLYDYGILAGRTAYQSAPLFETELFDSTTLPVGVDAYSATLRFSKAGEQDPPVASLTINIDVDAGSSVPEPGSLALAGLALAGLAVAARRRKPTAS
ncbi:MAG: PEP-CTERM sorting domain-containing protein [Rubrivivax sp.]|nr:PEP-CTERM sorting domain-containing protein [Rubrivivax sp.]